MGKNVHKNYIPQQQDIILLNFDPALGHEIKKRRPALVMSNNGYSQVTGLVVITPITHAEHNSLKDFFIPIYSEKVNGFINPLQFFTYDFRKRCATKIDMVSTETFMQAKITISNILE